MLVANVKQTPKGDKYFIEEVLKRPKTENISQVIMVSQLIITILIHISCLQITKSNTSITIQGDYKIWPTQTRNQDQSDKLEEHLQMIKSETNKLKKNCTSCNEGDMTCNCTIEVRRENEFDILILLDTNEGLKWCPESTVDSNFFKCSPDSFNRIKASQVIMINLSQVIMINLTIKYHELLLLRFVTASATVPKGRTNQRFFVSRSTFRS